MESLWPRATRQRPTGRSTNASWTVWPTLCGACSAADMCRIGYPRSAAPIHTHSAWPSRLGRAKCTGSGKAPAVLDPEHLKGVHARSGDRERQRGAVDRVGREPSGTSFNSLVQLEHEHGIPCNPFINAGALVVTDRLLTLTGDACGAVERFLRTECACPEIASDQAVASSEAEHGDRNAALAHFVASYGNLENPVGRVLDHYVRHCAIAMSCAELALAGGFLARHGVRRDGSRLVSRSDAKRINAVMLTCGTYDAAGEFAYRVGAAGQKRRCRRHPRDYSGALQLVRVEPGSGRQGQLDRGHRGSRCVHDPDWLVGVLAVAGRTLRAVITTGAVIARTEPFPSWLCFA